MANWQSSKRLQVRLLNLRVFGPRCFTTSLRMKQKTQVKSMQIQCQCPHCSTTFKVPERVLGKRTKCTKCGEQFELIQYESTPSTRAENAASEEAAAFQNWTNVDIDTGNESSAAGMPLPPAVIPTTVQNKLGPIEFAVQPALSDRTGARRFRALRFICAFIEITAAIIAIAVFAMGLLLLLTIRAIPDATAADVWRIVFECLQVWFVGGITVAVVLAFSQSVRLFLQIEQNTFEAKGLQKHSNSVLTAIQAELPARVNLPSDPV